MYILHIETSTENCSVALSNDDQIIECIDNMEGMNHTAILAPSIQKILKTSALSPSALGAISISSGPGSYTGLRVGSSTAKAMAYSLKIPLVAIPSPTSLANAAFHKYPEAVWALPMLDARRNEVYTCLFDRMLGEHLPVSSVILENEAVSDLIPHGIVVVCGNGANKLLGHQAGFPDITIDQEIQSSARHMVRLAFNLINKKEFCDPLLFVPSYLKPPNITQQRKLF
jgi:tRNA threonylcarbamoyladenosine biosynthesis protein TsaB